MLSALAYLKHQSNSVLFEEMEGGKEWDKKKKGEQEDQVGRNMPVHSCLSFAEMKLCFFLYQKALQ